MDGTVPIAYKGCHYNIPVEIIISLPYPESPVLAFVRPVQGMEVKRNHTKVGMDGRVYLPYLADWRPSSHRSAFTVHVNVKI